MKLTKNILDPFIKLWQKANGEKRKVTSKFFEAFFWHTAKSLYEFCMKMFCEMAFLSFARKSCASHEKAARKLLMKLMPGGRK